MPRLNQRFCKILGLTMIKAAFFVVIALIVAYLVWGRSVIGEIFFQATPIIATGWAIRNVLNELRAPPPLKR